MDAANIARTWSSHLMRATSNTRVGIFTRATKQRPIPHRCLFTSQASPWAQQSAAAVRPSTTSDNLTSEQDSGVSSQTQGSARPARLDGKDRELLNKGLEREGSIGISSSPHTTRHKTPSAQAPSYASAPLLPQRPTESTASSSLSDMTTAYANFGSRPSQSLSSTILFPTAPRTGTGSREVDSQPPKLSNVRYESLHLTTRSGKTLQVDGGRNVDLGAKFRALSQIVKRNRIRQDVFRQKFHERGGLKRKRLHSERWRRRFKDNFTKIVNRVQELRRQGW